MQFLRIYVEEKHKVDHNWTEKDKKQTNRKEMKEQNCSMHLSWVIFTVFKLLLQIRICARLNNRLYLHPIQQSMSYFTVLLKCDAQTYPQNMWSCIYNSQ